MAEPPKQVDLSWEAAEDLPVAASNVFVAQFTHGEFTLTFGYASPLLVTAQDVARLTSVKVKPVARLSLSPTRMQELIDVLKGNMEQYQRAKITSETTDNIKH